MIAVDTNLLVYAHRVENPNHLVARKLIRGLSESKSRWAIPWPCVHEFFAIATNPGVFDPPTPVGTAKEQIAIWSEAPSLHLLSEAADHWSRLEALIDEGAIYGAKVHDARIAAICLSHGVRELWTVDRDFQRFPSLRTRNPLIDPPAAPAVRPSG